MENIFDDRILEHPTEYEYLWKFIKKEHVKSFLDGYLYFSPLFDYSDYFEAITPFHHLILSYKNKFSTLPNISKPKHPFDIKIFLQNLKVSSEVHRLEKQLKKLTGYTETKQLIEILEEGVINLDKFEKKNIQTLEKDYLVIAGL